MIGESGHILRFIDLVISSVKVLCCILGPLSPRISHGVGDNLT